MKSVLGTKASSWLPWGRKRYFDRAVFDADLRRIELYYQDRGYPDAKVTAFDADLNDTQDAIALSVTVNEGAPRIVERVVLEGFDLIPPDDLLTLRRQLPLQPGAVVDRAQVVATQTMAARALQDRGYPLALVSTEETPVPAKQVTLTLRASPGAEALYGPVTVSGNVSVGDDVITRTLAFKPGHRFSLATIQLSQRRLYELGLFQLATVSPRTEEVADGLVPVQVTVAEAKHRQIRLGAGYGSEERLRGQAEWKHVNFFGGARTARVEGKYSALERGLRGSVTQPYLFSPKVSLTLSGQAWYTDEPAYQLDANGGRATVTYELSQRNPVTGRGGRSQLSVSVIGERDDYVIEPWALADLTIRSELIALGLDPRRGEAHGFLGAIALDYQRSTADNVLDASSGYTLLGHLETCRRLAAGRFRLQGIQRRGPALPPHLAHRGTGEPRTPCDHRSRRGEHQSSRGPGGHRRGRRAVLQALLPGRFEQPARLGALRGRAAQRVGPADRWIQPCRNVHGVPGAALRQTIGRPVRRCGKRRARALGRRAQRTCATTPGWVCAT